MADFILIEGDTVIFMPSFTPATVVVQPGKLEGSGPATIGGKKICVDGDESKVAVAGCAYMTPQYSIPGNGTLKISALAGNQKATKTQTGGKAVLLKGGNFTAKFEVQSPAQQPPPGPGSPVPDATPQYSGNGMFVTTNAKFTGV
jgi:Contractile injection system spike tip protein